VKLENCLKSKKIFFLKSWTVEDKQLLGTAGRSGSLFYQTTDSRYFFKTCLAMEIAVVKEFIQRYYNHLKENPKSLLIRFFGMFKVSTNDGSTTVIVFENLFPFGYSLSEKYDLKGRKAKRDDTPVAKSSLIKDNQLNRKFCIPDNDLLHLYAEQINKDVTFLDDNNLMDYSLLIGVYVPPKAEEDPALEKKDDENGKKSKKNLSKKTLPKVDSESEDEEENTKKAKRKSSSKKKVDSEDKYTAEVDEKTLKKKRKKVAAKKKSKRNHIRNQKMKKKL